MIKNTSTPRYLPVKEIAKIFPFAEATIYSWYRKGKVEATKRKKIGNQFGPSGNVSTLFINVKSVEKHIAEHNPLRRVATQRSPKKGEVGFKPGIEETRKTNGTWEAVCARADLAMAKRREHIRKAFPNGPSYPGEIAAYIANRDFPGLFYDEPRK